jgi:hypothetical protein
LGEPWCCRGLVAKREVIEVLLSREAQAMLRSMQVQANVATSVVGPRAGLEVARINQSLNLTRVAPVFGHKVQEESALYVLGGRRLRAG